MKNILAELKLITPPKMIREALALYGTLETAGTKSNPIILNWAKETNTKYDDWYNDDSIPWCGLFMAVVAQRAGKEVPENCLSALSWMHFGVKVDVAMRGDTLVFKRKGGGHVGIYVGESEDTYFVLGGNQGDKVCIAELSKSRLYAIRRPIYTDQPSSVVRCFYNKSGELSSNEA